MVQCGIGAVTSHSTTSALGRFMPRTRKCVHRGKLPKCPRPRPFYKPLNERDQHKPSVASLCGIVAHSFRLPDHIPFYTAYQIVSPPLSNCVKAGWRKKYMPDHIFLSPPSIKLRKGRVEKEIYDRAYISFSTLYPHKYFWPKRVQFVPSSSRTLHSCANRRERVGVLRSRPVTQATPFCKLSLPKARSFLCMQRRIVTILVSVPTVHGGDLRNQLCRTEKLAEAPRARGA